MNKLDLREDKPFVSLLHDQGIEPDQRLRQALSYVGRSCNDERLFHALYRLNSVLTRYLTIDPTKLRGFDFDLPPKSERLDPDKVTLELDNEFIDIITRAITTARTPGTLGTRDFLRCALEVSIELENDYIARPFLVDFIAQGAFGNLSATPSNPRISEARPVFSDRGAT